MFTHLFALAFICLAALDTASAQNGYVPIGPSAIFTDGIISANGDGNGIHWVIQANNSQDLWRMNTTTNTYDYLRNWADGAPKTANPPVGARVRVTYPSYGPSVLYIEDSANEWIAVLDAITLQWYPPINVYGFSNFVVSPEGGFLAVGGVQGSDKVDFIDVYSTIDYQRMYRVNVAGLDAKIGFSLVLGPDVAYLYVPIGLNNSIMAYEANFGRYKYSIPINAPDFNVSAVASDTGQSGTIASIAAVDCVRGKVYFNAWNMAQPNVYTLSRFNTSMCSESVSSVGVGNFVVLNGFARFEYFRYGQASIMSSTHPAVSDESVDHVAIAFGIAIGVLVFVFVIAACYGMSRHVNTNHQNLQALLPHENEATSAMA